MSASYSSRVYCTYFDSGYLSRGLALIESLRAHGDHSVVYVLALDESAHEFLTFHGPENVVVLSIETIEAVEPTLRPLRDSRSRMEYYFTCTPLLMRYVMNQHNVPGSVTIYLDGDLFFFENPSCVIDALGDDSVGIIEHRYPASLESKLAKYGRFNVGWVGFRDDVRGRTVLDWYSERTLEWCSDNPENGKYADQGYLNWFPDFEGVAILHSGGFNLAPWNVKRHTITEHKGQITVDGEKLVFFHFHGLRRVGNRYATAEITYGARLTSVLKRKVYQPYVHSLHRIETSLSGLLATPTGVKKRGTGLTGVVSRARKHLLNVAALVTGNSVKDES